MQHLKEPKKTIWHNGKARSQSAIKGMVTAGAAKEFRRLLKEKFDRFDSLFPGKEGSKHWGPLLTEVSGLRHQFSAAQRIIKNKDSDTHEISGALAAIEKLVVDAKKLKIVKG